MCMCLLNNNIGWLQLTSLHNVCLEDLTDTSPQGGSEMGQSLLAGSPFWSGSDMHNTVRYLHYTVLNRVTAHYRHSLLVFGTS